jgi:[ribosomal protein S18]-alanine N-acetyltransferase
MIERLKSKLIASTVSASPMIRKIKAGDAVAVARLLAASPGAAPWSPLRSPVTPDTETTEPETLNTAAFVAEQDGEVAGIIVTRIAADEAEILNLAVLPTVRRRGLARALLLTALAAARALNARRAFLEVRESNLGARAFYSRMGFIECGRRHAYYREPAEDALILTFAWD